MCYSSPTPSLILVRACCKGKSSVRVLSEFLPCLPLDHVPGSARVIDTALDHPVSFAGGSDCRASKKPGRQDFYWQSSASSYNPSALSVRPSSWVAFESVPELAPGFYAAEGRCWRMVRSGVGHGIHCREPAGWTGRYVNPKGKGALVVRRSGVHLSVCY
jgi:hypothetical protein